MLAGVRGPLRETEDYRFGMCIDFHYFNSKDPMREAASLNLGYWVQDAAGFFDSA